MYRVAVPDFAFSPKARRALINTLVEVMNPSLSSVEEEEEWAPKWKSLHESPQFVYGMLDGFLETWEEEDFEHIADSKHKNCDDNCHQRLSAFLKQVRESRGYDVDDPPWCVMSPFFPMHMDEIKIYDIGYEELIAKVEFVVAQINGEAKQHGKLYELDEIEKVVEAWAHRCTLLTLRVKQVRLSRRKRMKQLESINANADVVKTVQATVFAECYNERFKEFELVEWRFKPLNTSSA
ncbi:uncharacterized protein LOC130991486 [Salvia miltiorrhiza]|uniref:uncharacterized protein LOC130991486 n=1 Tax=Salvia miltiorrhiza TaxID=226208 RepID=UPI0025AD39CA|nr:uncharacterized protein LOC130991486 [Salvia miltiorrhiza]